MPDRILTITMRCESDAFYPDPRPEAVRILRVLADCLEAGDDFDRFRTLFDCNGNDVGRAKLSDHHND